MSSHAPTLFTDLNVSLDHQSGHMLIAGNSGSGKTGALCLIARHKLRNPTTGFLLVDPDGEISPHCAEYLANPEHGLHWRKFHYLKPASPTDSFALPLLHVPDRSPQKCHDKAVRALTIFEQAVTVGAGDYGPRLSKFFYCGALGLALTGRSLVDLPDLYGRGARHLRELIGNSFPYPFLTDEWQSLDLLSDRAFLEYRDPLVSRLMPIFGNARMRRCFGPHCPVDIATILQNREAAALDLSGMEHKDAVLIGKAFLSLLYHEALQREPNREPHTCCMLDESFDYMSPDFGRGFDRLRKRHVQLVIVTQRLLNQLGGRAQEDSATILSAVMSGTNTKIVFRLPEPDDADLMTNLLFRGFMDLEEWKERPSSLRPTAIGNKKEIVRSRSKSVHEAEHAMHSHSRSRARGEARGTASGTATSLGEFNGSGDSAGLVMAPPAQLFAPNAPNASVISYPLSQSTGESNSRGSSEQSSTSLSESRMESDMYAEADSAGHGMSRGTSTTEGESETFVTDYALLSPTMFTLQEQLHRLAGEIQNLAHRECFVKIQNQRPVRTRTRDLEPAFKSDYFRRVMAPIFHKTMVARSGYLFPVAEVDAQIAQRLQSLQPIQKAEPDFSKPEPMPSHPIDDPVTFARDFVKRRAESDQKPPKPKNPRPKSPLGRRPRGGKSLGPKHDKFRVIDGDGGDNEKKK